jgi:hypothetical protein
MLTEFILGRSLRVIRRFKSAVTEGAHQLKLTTKTIERGLIDKQGAVRSGFAAFQDYTPIPAQIARGLADWSSHVRIIFATRWDYSLTSAQIERGLADESVMVKHAITRRKEYHLWLAAQ